MDSQRSEYLRFLYSECLQEERFLLDEHQKRVAFMAGLISTLFAATVLGILEANSPVPALALLIGPFLIASFAHLGRCATFRFYRRFVEVISQRKKIEFELGMYEPRGLGGGWMGDAPLVAARHRTAGMSVNSDAAFVEKNETGGYQRVAEAMFDAMAAGAALLGIVVVARVFTVF